MERGHILKPFFFWGGGGGEDRISLCSSDLPGTHYIDQTDLELAEIHLPVSQAYILKLLRDVTGAHL